MGPRALPRPWNPRPAALPCALRLTDPAQGPPQRPARFRVALVGAGAIAETHLAILRSLPDVEVVALVDHQLERAQRLAARHGVGLSFADPGQLAGLLIDVAHVLVPPDQHARVVR